MTDVEAPTDSAGKPHGKLPPEHDSRTLALDKYRNTPTDCDELPESCDWRPRVHEIQAEHGQLVTTGYGRRIYHWGKMRNVTLNDCTIAAGGHMIQVWTANSGNVEVTVPDEAIVAAYSGMTRQLYPPGWNPDDAPPGPGGGCLGALRYWRHTGIGDHKIDAFVKLDEQKREEAKVAIYLFGGAYIGLALPESAKKQFVWGKGKHPAHASTDKYSWEGHAVCAVAYTPKEVTVITWGREQRMTWDFYERYCDEAYGVLSHDFVTARGETPHHLNLDALIEDVEAIAHS